MVAGETGGGGGARGNPYEAPQSAVGPSPGPAGPARAGQYAVECGCGRATWVAASQAGSEVRCGCGAGVKVPSLGRLRELAGKDRYESSTPDTVRRMLQTGELPGPAVCALSGEPTDDVLPVTVLLPRYARSGAAFGGADTLLMLLAGFWGVLLYTVYGGSKFAEEGADAVATPLRVAARHHGKVARMSQRRLRRLLAAVPVYAKLLGENPAARVVPGEPPGGAAAADSEV